MLNREAVLEIIEHYGRNTPLSRDYIGELCRLFQQYYGFRYVLPVDSGTAALHTALAAAGIGSGDMVLLPVNVCASVPMAVLSVGALPVLVDTDASLNMDAEALESMLDAHPRTRAVIVVHQHGIPANMERLTRIVRAKKTDVCVIEDCAQAHSTTIRGKPVGRYGDMAVFSFNKGKILSAGSGGLLATANEEWYERAFRFAQLGARQTPYHETFGYNYQMSELQACIIAGQLRNIAELSGLRRRNAGLYREQLDSDAVRPVLPLVEGESSWHRFVVHLSVTPEAYRQLADELRRQGLPFQEAHPCPLYRAKFLQDYYRANRLSQLADESGSAFPNFAEVGRNLMFLYTHAQMTEDCIRRICALLNKSIRAHEVAGRDFRCRETN